MRRLPFLIVSLMLLVAVHAQAATFTVNSTADTVDAIPGDGVCETAPGGGICTLRAAIQEANALPGADTIILPAGTYTLSIVGYWEDLAASGDLDITGNLRLIGGGASTTIIETEGQTLDRVLQVHSGAMVEITGATIQNGGIETPTFIGLDGGGVHNAGTLTLTDVTIRGNRSTGGGGGIYNSGVLNLTRVTVTENKAAFIGQAGGIFNSGSAVLIDVNINRNFADSNAGGIFNAGNATLSNVSINENYITSSLGNGGGIYNSGNIIINGAAITGNTAGPTGGGLRNEATAKLSNVTISGNLAGTGSGIANRGSNAALRLTNVTISENTANFAGGGLTSDEQAVATLANVILSGNTADPEGSTSNCGGHPAITIVSLGHNLDSGNTCGFAAIGDLINIDPLLGPLQDNGGPTFTQALLNSSPAIDTGDNAFCPEIDQRGAIRPFDGNKDGVSICDIGAYESGSFIPGAELKLAAIQPTKGGNAGLVTVTIRGSGFQEGAVVKLLEGGSEVLAGQNTIVTGQTRIQATFDLHGQVPRPLTLQIVNPDGKSVTAVEPFVVEEGGQSKLWTDIVGRTLIRVGSPYTYMVYYGNSGNIDSPYPWLEVALPSNTSYDVNVPPALTPITPLEPAPADALKVTLLDLPPLPPGGSGFVMLKIIPDSLGEIPIRALIEPEAATYLESIKALQQTAPLESALASQTLAVSAEGSSELPCIPANCEAGWPMDDPNPPAGYICYWYSSKPFNYRIDNNCLVMPKPEEKNGGFHIAKSIGGGKIIELWAFSKSCPGKKDLIVRDLYPDEKNINPSFLGCFKPFPEYDQAHADQVVKRSNLELIRDEAGGATWVWNNTVKCLYDEGDTKLKADCLGFVHKIDPELLGEKGLVGVDQLYDKMRAAAGPNYPSPEKWPGPASKYESNVLPGCIKRYLAMLNARIKMVIARSAFDPNDKSGAAGYGSSRFTSPSHITPYLINFENLETATAASQEVVITDQLDSSKLELNTFSLGAITLGDKLITPPLDVTTFNSTVDLRPAKNLLININAGLDPTTGVVAWRFTALDPATGQPPEDPLTGFLPPNVKPPEGEGSVSFTVMPKAGLVTGTEIRNKATITFDTNAPIETPEWLNTIDKDNPLSEVLGLPATHTNTTFQVRWSGTDVGAGVKDYTIYVSEDGGPFAPWLSNTPSTEGQFTGQVGKSYAFYSIARDQTGNVEDAPANPDTSTTVTEVVANRPPIANAGPDQTVECTGQGGASVTLDGSGSSDPDNDPLTYTWTHAFGTANGVTPTVPCPMGTNTITLTVSDGKGGTASDTVMVKVVDTTSPAIQSVAANPSSLWPPNHKMVPVTVTVSAKDLCSATTTCKIIAVNSNEPVNGTGDGDTAPDWEITGNLTVNLRAERAGSGSGRVYTITVQCTDASGNSSTKDVAVTVPHDKRK